MSDGTSPVPHPPYTPDGAAVDAIAAELMHRLRPVLGAMPESEFLDLVRVMAERQDRWQRRERTRGP
ncbi:hypothetical protein [Roseisolibacter sp. H3M3-2]|uniref:hypothetical protein n=1 Tax=Roseisolibacter sp. H3M3-2 TaxID=3031323 RepID=UPI0023DC8C63|nr:hypothetical protein [Roseisolibacter sp. H3M3-2]MDF1505051.1 hypothetical protein [Roseisolibacter sp. H3M3-2]